MPHHVGISSSNISGRSMQREETNISAADTVTGLKPSPDFQCCGFFHQRCKGPAAQSGVPNRLMERL